MPEISVIIPTYQHARDIVICLESLFAQTLSDIEIIVVNDGSTDNTEERLLPFMSRIRYMYQDNAGANSARNKGATYATGRFLLFCDADIVMEPYCLERLRDALLQAPHASYAYASFRFGFKRFRLWPFDGDTLRRMNYIHTTSLIRKEHFPGFDPAIRRLQDWDLWLTMLARGYTGVWVSEYLFRVIPHEGGISTWVPGILYRIPWKSLGIRFRTIEAFQQAELHIRKKHNLPEAGL